MVLNIATEPPPLRVDDSGTVRVGGCRLTLDTFIGYYNQGLTAADLIDCFPSLSLADAHAVIAYYLRHRDEVDAYLQTRAEQAAEIRRDYEARFPRRAITKEELLARWEQKTGRPFPHQGDATAPAAG